MRNSLSPRGGHSLTPGTGGPLDDEPLRHATTGVTRIADLEWDAQVASGKPPPRPDWTKEYLRP